MIEMNPRNSFTLRKLLVAEVSKVKNNCNFPMFPSKIVLFSIFVFTTYSVTLANRSVDQINDYLNQVSIGKIVDVTVPAGSSKFCEEYVEVVLKRPGVSFINHNGHLEYNLGKISDSFIFVTSLDDLKPIIANIVKTTARYHHFIICDPLNDKNNVKTVLYHVWKMDIFNFVLVFFYEKLEMLSYNKFVPQKILKFKNISDIYVDKLDDLGGYGLKVGVYKEYPMVVEKDGLWSGNDIDVLQALMDSMNAKVIIKDLSSSNLLFDMLDVDFTFARRIWQENLKDYRLLVNQKRDALVGLVPIDRIPPDTYFFSIFEADLLFCFCLIIVIVATICKLGKFTSFSSASYHTVLLLLEVMCTR